MKDSQKLAILYRQWAKEIWKMVSDHLDGSYTWSYFDDGRLVYVKIGNDKSERVFGLEFGQHSQIGLVFQVNKGDEKRFFIPMQFILENLQILKDFLQTGEIISSDVLNESYRKFNETNPDFFEEELKHSISVNLI